MFWKRIFRKKVEKPTYLIIGLGNPGREYRLNRHNIGFRVIDHLNAKWDIPLNHLRNKALVGYKTLTNYRIILAKPQTFMNQSGESVAALVRFYKVHFDHLFVIYDDIDLQLGTLRLRKNGSSAGHKGLTSIIQTSGSSDFPHLRLGIGRPSGKMDVMKYVLQNFSEKEEVILNLVLEQACAAIQSSIDQGIESAMTQFNGSVI
jgi:PTH1 family peptidyl-tRNA hydrolase